MGGIAIKVQETVIIIVLSCHWPRDRIPQLVNHMIMQHNIDVGLIRHLNKKSKLFTIYVPFICKQSTTVMLYSELMWSLIVMC